MSTADVFIASPYKRTIEGNVMQTSVVQLNTLNGIYSRLISIDWPLETDLQF